MKYFSLLALSLLLLPLCLYSKDTVKWVDDTPEPQIKAEGRFSKEKDPKAQNSKRTPDGSIAREIAVDGYRFQWRPKWNFTGLGGAILPFVIESYDKSTLGIVETLPQKDAPASSIIVFINLGNFDIINYTVMPGKDVRKFCFVPFSSKITCIIQAPYDKYYPEPKFQLQTIDTRNAEIISSTPKAKLEPVAVCSSGKKVFAAFKGSNQIRVYDPDKLSVYKTIETVNKPAVLKCTPDGKTLLVAGSSEIQLFDIEQQVIPEKTIRLPAFFSPDKIVLCSDDASKLLLSVFGGATYYYSDGDFRKVCKRTDADIAWGSVGKFIFIGLPSDSVAFYKTNNLETPEMELKFKKQRPHTNGKLYKIVPLPGSNPGIAVFDKRGALLHFIMKRNRWIKTVIIDQPTPL